MKRRIFFFLVAFITVAVPVLAYHPEPAPLTGSSEIDASIESLFRGWFQEWMTTGEIPDLLGDFKRLVPHFLSGTIEDNLNRISNATYLSSETFDYTYDPTGNILTVDKNGSNVGTYSYSNNQINDSGYTYDADGNLTADGYNTYTYNAFNQTSAITNTLGTVNFQYDPMGKRILKSDGSGDTIYAYLGEQLLSEYDGTDYTDSVFFDGQLLARVTDDGATTEIAYAHLNYLGSPVAFTDNTMAPGTSVIWPEQTGSATPYEIHAYEPFGADFDDIGTPPVSNEIRYSGKLFDADTGKHYFNARYLNAVTDTTHPELPPRFLTSDVVIGSPGNPQGWNRYASCLNNPVMRIDPDGLVDIVVPAIGYGDENTFSSRAGKVVETYPSFKWFRDTNIDTGSRLLTVLESETSKSDPLENLILFSHGYVRGIIFRSERGFYSSADPSSDLNLAAYIEDLGSKISSGKIHVDKSGRIVLLGCNLATGDFASKLSQTTGMRVIASQGSVYPQVENGVETGTFFSGGAWKSYYKGEEMDLGKELKIW